MAQASPQLPHTSSRLIRFLNDLAISEVSVSHKHFTARLAQLIDLSDSITLSTTHSRLKTTVFERAPVSIEAVKAQFLKVQTSLVQFIVNSFTAGTGPGLIKLPAAVAYSGDAATTAYQPYQRFYAAHQRQIDLKVRKLQSLIRDSASGISPELAQLCVLDSTLGDMLADHARKCFGVIPKLLERRFEHLLLENAQALSQADELEDAWKQTLEQFCTEIRGLLLAETETRLLPVLGLIEAINEATDNEAPTTIVTT